MLLKQEEKTLEEQLVDVKNKVEEAKAITNWSTRTSRLKQVFIGPSMADTISTITFLGMT